ncbi:3-oxoacyl-[acyl-carrier-protein] synthase II [Cyclonatronum proteinivorum]|uniref:3-oxoacyl-[acyl-carrier-protein] synthase 2 n=1 Tax=Cyclonatronum proteinivorum TaxID=1457365 RepID=A0A345UM38_9BACT|nr:beta-ketoacyl-ACP synthase II [Cyclonatronum proteinivorum]AXJ01540.1 3-oxoacyl-[acyl-carrier-protein] synthase II [Cyclonatronum proteinivorum]
MAERRVVVTGMGAITPIGNDLEQFWDGLKNGKSGVDYIKHFDTERFATKFAAMVNDFKPGDFIEPKAARRLDRFSQFALAASDMAIADASIDLETVDKNRVAVLVGTGIGGMDTFYKNCVAFEKMGPRGISPFFIPMLIPDIASGHISIKYGFRGPNYCAVSACATGSHNIGLAYDHIRSGQSDFAVCGGAEAPIIEMGVSGFNAIKAMSTRNDDPQTASRPFDKDRDGFVLGEGSGILFLETYESAVKRGARIYAEIVGYGFSADAHHITAPDPEGAGVMLAITQALEAANIKPEDIDHINMHGTSTPLGDIAETNSIKKVFGDHAYKINLNSTKSMTGHMLGAAGAAEAIATILALYHDLVPPTINHFNTDPLCDLNYTVNEAQDRKMNYALNNAFGFGGHNTTLVMKKFDE